MRDRPMSEPMRFDDAMMRLPSLAATALYVAANAFAADASPVSKEPPVSSHTATGPFEVKLAPQALSSVAAQSGLGRMSLDKQYHGALEAASSGEMLAFGNPSAAGSAGYVAMERVHGTLD